MYSSSRNMSGSGLRSTSELSARSTTRSALSMKKSIGRLASPLPLITSVVSELHSLALVSISWGTDNSCSLLRSSSLLACATLWATALSVGGWCAAGVQCAAPRCCDLGTLGSGEVGMGGGGGFFISAGDSAGEGPVRLVCGDSGRSVDA